ncbi:DUF4352 domain-containing protein [Agrococcus sp. ARC_14]|uniref:DUF4352 domain-containing protein n=1 Tax=Agrococcus sp. ARC_14 TaxID=2919927 RepID=UPI001F06B6C9|nr:DUF4352 domain-containing protein [Agrococcus sp. ARC_14]MCH1881671.1 DUF4352 domain-containing protein [Agrococcus sp. ARC_14]
MRRVLAWVLGIALMAVAGVVGAVSLDDTQTQAPFAVEATIGERAAGRDIAVTVTDVRVADEVVDDRGWRASGTWLVVDLEAEAVRSERASLLSLAELDLGDRRISASERPESLLDVGLAVGVPQRGALAFELPEGALAGPATLRLGRSSDPRVDSLVELRIDLTSLEHVDELELQESGWVG